MALDGDGDGQRPGAKEWCQCPRLKMVQDVGMWCPDCFTVRDDKLQIDTREPVFSEDRGAGPPPAKRCYIRQGGKRQQKQAEMLQLSRNRQSDGTEAGEASKPTTDRKAKARKEPKEKREKPPKEPKKRERKAREPKPRAVKKEKARPKRTTASAKTGPTASAVEEAVEEGAPLALTLALTGAAQAPYGRPKRRSSERAEQGRGKRPRRERVVLDGSEDTTDAGIGTCAISPTPGVDREKAKSRPEPRIVAALDTSETRLVEERAAETTMPHDEHAAADAGGKCPVHGHVDPPVPSGWMAATLAGLVAKKDRARARVKARRKRGSCTCPCPTEAEVTGLPLPPCIAEASTNLSPDALAEAEAMFDLAKSHPSSQGASNKKLRGVFLASLYGAATKARCGFDLTAARRAMGISSHAFNEACLLLNELRADDHVAETHNQASMDHALAALDPSAQPAPEAAPAEPQQQQQARFPPGAEAGYDESLGAFVRKAVQKLQEDAKAGGMVAEIDADKIEHFAQFARRSCANLNSAHARSVCAAALWVFFGPKTVSERAICNATMVSSDTLKRYAKLLALATPGVVRIAAAISLP